MSILVIDYGMGNLGSVKRSFEECGAEVIISDQPRDLDAASKIVLPGVGAFADAMERLHAGGWTDAIHGAVINDHVPMLGICLGMQVLAEKGYEGGEVSGLGLIAGEVRRLQPESADVRVPHVGWNEVHQVKANPLLHDIPGGADFYFVHSYHFVAAEAANIVATTPYCGNIVSVVTAGNIFGVQFHPEKSSRVGFQLLKNFLAV
jgi:glutamine amidotransferase